MKGVQAFVGHKFILTVDDLQLEIGKYFFAPTYYFVMYSHDVSGICTYLPQDFFQGDGHLFNQNLELRWRRNRQQHGWDILLLAKGGDYTDRGFQPLEGNWRCLDRSANFYEQTNKRFPKGFRFLREGGEEVESDTIKIKQRYFYDHYTYVVHFVALTVEE
ncbi:MAG: hypothetical protein ACK421_08635 [Pseudanabaenaceae cyanobacterium]